jgi:hypothetical protein
LKLAAPAPHRLLTLPVCVFLGSGLFAGALLLLAKMGVH